MKKLLLLNILLALIFTLKAQNRVIFYENFDAAVKPSGWTQEKVIGLGGTPSGSTISWQYTSGGYYGYPEYPYQGTRNAMFQLESDKGETTKLITPPIDISDVLKPELRFAHVQQIWEFEGTDYWDRLKIYYKRGADSAWVLLKTYDSAVPNWVDRSILLPDSSKSSTYYIAFEGKTGFGYGTCIDSMRIIETGLEAKYLSSYTINQASTDFIPTNTLRNPIININFDVKGNDGNIYLDSIKITSLNSDDSHISNNGVKLYVTTDSVFYNPIQIGNGINFENGVAFFKNLQYDLPRGNTTLWVTYDIAEALDHDIHNSIVDAKITAESIFINGYAYPFTDKSPEGFRLIKEAIFNDSFETNLGWTLNGSFEIAEPLGLGILFPGNPDPSDAYNGLKILGTDLTSDGVYSNELPKKYDNAISPNFNCRYFKDVTLYFARWLNIEYWDKATIDISNNNKATWTEIWRNTGAIIEDSWNIKSYNLNNANFYDNVSIRISIDTTNDVNQYTGWNIDDFIVIGNYISRDVGVSEIITPITSCGHTVSDEIKVKIKNYAGENSNDTIPIRYSIDNSTNYTVDTLFQSIPIGDSAIFTFSVGANLSASGSHSIKVETLLSGDEIPTNNSKSKTIFSFPTLVLPYIQNFENNYGYFLSGGINSTWSYGKPSSTLINSAASGTKAWVTNLIGPYSSNDSSYLESPCFNFTENDSIIFEFKCKGISEDKTDGLSILYTFDEGENWIPLPNDHDYYWNWYNETNISELELPGIDTTNGQWLTFRQLLPPAFSNKGTVKFRFVFESDASTNYEGFGIDDIKIYDAPYDVGVSSLTYPFDQCEWNDTTHVKIQVKNYGPTPVKTGTKIPLVMKFNSLTIKDTLTLTQNLAVNGTTPFTFTNTVDMSYAGAYDFTIYTKLESNTYFYDETTSNDTLYSIVNVLGMPRYNPFPNQIGDNPIDTFLVAGKDYVSYYWTRPSLPDTTTLTTDTLFIKNNEGWYKVTVTNANACQANDSVEVVNSEIDLAMDYIYTELVDSCERISLTEISVRFRNKSITTLEINDTVALAYQINDSQIVRDTLIVTTPIANDETGDFTFTIHADFKTPGDYTLKVFTDFLKDLNLSDDTLSVSFRTKGYVDIEFAYDTIFSSRADTLKLAPWTLHNTYSDYLWTPGGSTDDTLDVSLNISQWYKVTVSDIIVCESDSDSVYVETYDMAIENLNSPANRCQNNITGSTDINVRIKNYSGNTYNSSAPLTFMYNFNGAGWTEKNMTLGTTLIPNAETNLSLVNIDRTVPGEYSVEVYLKSAIDANSSNDSVNDIFETYPLPSVNLAYDTIFTSRADTVVLVADPGWNSYTWNTGSTNDSLFITSKYSREYYVDVEDEHGCGIASDTTWIITYNVGVNDLISPKSACEHSSTESVIISVKNYGQDTLLNGMKIPVGYILDGNSPVHETMTLSADLLPGKTTFYTFGSKVNISSINTYKFKVYTHLSLDVNTTNDTLVDVIKTFGYPSIEIGDNIYTTEPETLTLVAPSGYNNYKWNDGTSTNTLAVTYPATKLYSVTVTDINGCSTTDHLTVFTYNIQARSLVSPIAKCAPTATETVIIGVSNQSADTLLTGQQLIVGYRLNGNNLVSQNFTLTKTLYPDSTELFTLNTYPADLRENITHEFKVFAKLTNIDVETDDTTTIYVDNLKPNFDLGPDVQTGQTQYTIDAGAGYTTYQWFNGSANRTYTVDINDQSPNFYYAVTVTNSYGCQATDSIMVTFDLTPDLQMISMSSPVSDCWQSGETYPVQVTLQNVGEINIAAGTPLSIGYRINNGTPTIENINLSAALSADQTLNHTFASEIDFASAQVYIFKPFVKYSIDGDPTNDTLTVSLDISQPDVTFDYDTVYFSTTADIEPIQNFSSYLWSTGATTKRITVSETGTYTVTVTDANGCSGSGKVYCEKITGIENIIEGNGYSIAYFPNPVSEKLQVQFNNSQSMDVVMEIITPNGQIIYNKQFSKIQNTIERIDVNQFANGIYYIRFRINNEHFTRKIIIQ